ncbi:MAG: tetratricopeptide repeat protein [Pseudonocardia sp.]
MEVPERLVEVWAAGADGRGQCGSGWVVGERGVLSCWHVLDRYLADVYDDYDDDDAGSPAGPVGQPVLQVRTAASASAATWVDCVVAWRHPTRDLVLLQVSPGADQRWQPPAGHSPRLAATGQHPCAGVATGFPDAEVKPSGLRGSDQATGRLLPAGAARDEQGLVPFDVDSSVPDAARLWQGFSGSAVHDEHERLVALVAKVHPNRQQRRLLVVPLDVVSEDPAFATAAETVGLDPTVEDRDAPRWRASVDPRALTAAGAPQRVVDVEDLAVFGVRRGGASPVRGAGLGYLDRDKDKALDAALSQASSGGRRIVLLVGDSAAGKSRSACEAVRRDRSLRSWRIVVPVPDGGLFRLVDAGLDGQATVVWLDDLDKYLGRGLDLGTLRRLHDAAAPVVVVATMRASQLQARQGDLADPAWDFLTDDTEVARMDLDAALSERELAAARDQIDDAALLSALDEGVGLGEWLVAGPELMKRLRNATGLNRALADTVVAWYRTGLQEPLAEDDARRLWADTLAPEQRPRLQGRLDDARETLFQKASTWSCKPVIFRDLYEQALLTRTAKGYVAHDYVVDQTTRDSRRPAVPDAVWEHALSAASTGSVPAQRSERLWTVGTAAHDEHALAHSLTAMQILAEAGDPHAHVNVGVLLGGLGRSDEAIAVYDQVVDRYGDDETPALREQLAGALYNKAVVLGGLGRSDEAIAVYDQVADRYGDDETPALREQLAEALYNKGVVLGGLGRPDEAIAVYDQVADRYGDDETPALREVVAVARRLREEGDHKDVG